jgi:hypothetical protein
MDAASFSKTLTTRLHDLISQKTVIIIVIVVRTSDLAKYAYTGCPRRKDQYSRRS